MTWEEYSYRVYGYYVRQAREREPLRFIASILYNSNRGEKQPALTPEQLMPLITDKKRAVESIEERKERIAKQKEKALMALAKLNEKKRLEWEAKNGRSVKG